MNELIFKEELIENWIKILLIVSSLLIVAARLVGGDKFQFLIKFWNIDRYFIFKSGSTIPFFTSLNTLMFFHRINILLLTKFFMGFRLLQPVKKYIEKFISFFIVFDR